MAERPNKRARQDKDQGENNVLLTEIFDDDMLNEINEYQSEHSDDEYVYEDPVHDNLHVLAISNDSDEDINGDSNGDSNADRQVAENTKEDEIRKKVSSSTLSKKKKVFQSHMDKATEELTYYNMLDKMKVVYDDELKIHLDM